MEFIKDSNRVRYDLFKRMLDDAGILYTEEYKSGAEEYWIKVSAEHGIVTFRFKTVTYELKDIL